MKGFQKHGKDIDRQILLQISEDKQFLKLSHLNKYFKNEVYNDIFFKTRLLETYPNSLQYKEDDQTWKDYFIEVIYYIKRLDDDFDFIYTEGDLIKIFIQKYSGKDINDFLLKGAYNGELNLIKEALKRGADIHFDNDSSLERASGFGNLEIVKFLMENGAVIHSKNDNALRIASYNGHLEIVKYLIDNGSTISHLSLLYSIQNKHLEVVKFLIKHVDIHKNDDEGLIWACSSGSLEIVKYMIEHGSDVFAQNCGGLRMAKKYAHREIVDYLVSTYDFSFLKNNLLIK